MEVLLWCVGVLAYILFFGTDFYLAFLLQKLKHSHPAIVEATPVIPESEDDEEAEEGNNRFGERSSGGPSRRAGYEDADEEARSNSRHFGGAGGNSSQQQQEHQPASGYTSVDIDQHDTTVRSSTTRGGTAAAAQHRSNFSLHIDRNTSPKDVWRQLVKHPYMRAFGFGRKDNALLFQNIVLVLSALAPFLMFIQIIAPGAMAWSRFNIPAWLGYLTLLPGLGLSTFYAMRTYRVHLVMEVTKAQWISMTWFRLDVICVMAVITLVGWGDWLVALCLFFIDLYLAHRLLRTERTLVNSHGAEWLRNEKRSALHDDDEGAEDVEERANQPARALAELAPRVLSS